MKQLLILVGISTFLVFGCSKKKVVKPQVITAPTVEKIERNFGIEKFKDQKIKPLPVSHVSIHAVLLFEFDCSNLRASEVPVLDALIEDVKARPDIVIHLIGGCCPIGTEGYNLRLGYRRTRVAYNYLRQAGLKNEILCRSYGENNLVAHGKSNYWKNRRCEIRTE